MRKRIVSGEIQGEIREDQSWLDLELLAQAELSSEDPRYPIEEALKEGGRGWRASEPGEQTVSLSFDRPLLVRRVLLEFHEEERERSQEFLLRWSADGRTFRDIVRQQYNFSLPDSATELEEYTVDLQGVKVLELKIVPERSGGSARATLTRLRISGEPA